MTKLHILEYICKGISDLHIHLLVSSFVRTSRPYSQ